MKKSIHIFENPNPKEPPTQKNRRPMCEQNVLHADLTSNDSK